MMCMPFTCNRRKHLKHHTHAHARRQAHTHTHTHTHIYIHVGIQISNENVNKPNSKIKTMTKHVNLFGLVFHWPTLAYFENN